MKNPDLNAPAKCCNEPQVEIVVRQNQEIILVREWIPTLKEKDIHEIRPKIRKTTDKEEFTCFYCGQHVILRQSPNGAHYFAHKPNNNKLINCIYQQNHGISYEDLDRVRYQGAREGMRHIQTKNLIARIIKSDPEFSDPIIEKTWRTFDEGWRRPDVSSTRNGLTIVFEAQVSNTYPGVIAERTDFYTKQGALLIWIFDNLPNAWKSLHKDIFCSNEQHMFFVDEECAAFSEKEKKAFFRMFTIIPSVEPKPLKGNSTRLVLAQKNISGLIPFSSLKINIKDQKTTFFDIDQEEKICQHKILCANLKAENSSENIKKLNDFFQTKTKNSIKQRDIIGWATLICAIESQRLGVPIGTKNKSAIEVAHTVHDHYADFFPYLVKTLNKLNINPIDITGKWKIRAEEAQKALGNTPTLRENLLDWLYPKVTLIEN